MRGDKLALREATLSIGAGEHVAILGPNGCGKSTFIKAITRECYPLLRDGSHIKILGEERWDVASLRTLLGIVTNDLVAACTREFAGRDIVLSGFFSSIGIWPHHRVTAAMRDKAARARAIIEATHQAGRPVEEMSSGEARRVVIARALVHDPKTLLLDEPSNSLDLLAQYELREVMRKLARAGVGLLLVTHHIADVIPEIERVIFMREGELIADGAKKELLTAQRLCDLFGVRLEIAQRDGFYHVW